MEEDQPDNWLWRAVQQNSRRRAVRFEECKAARDMWMLECRDLWDSEDEDAGVYFVGCATGYAVNKFIAEMDPASDRIMGIFDLRKPLDRQRLGITLEEWQAGRRETAGND